MKKLLFLAVLIVAGCSTPPPVTPTAKFANILDGNNKIVADINKETGAVKFYDSPEKALLALYSAYIPIYNQLDSILHPKPPEDGKPSVKTEATKKDAKKKDVKEVITKKVEKK